MQPTSAGRRHSDADFFGFVLLGREVTAFAPCGRREISWLAPALGATGLELLKLRERQTCNQDAALPGCSRWLYVEMNGEQRAGGRYGHMGRYQNEISITKLFYASTISPPGCVLAAGSPPSDP